MPKNQDVWITGDGRHLPFPDMSDDHLASSFMNLCSREFEKFTKINRLYSQIDQFQKLKDKLQAEAKSRNIELKYPDQRFPSSQWGEYFEAERKTHQIEEAKIVLGADPIE